MASIGQKLRSNDALGAASGLLGLRITSERLRHWGMKSALSLVDQGFTSGAGFLVNLLLARWMPAEVYGAFAVAFAGFLFTAGFHNVLLLEPLGVIGPSRYSERLREFFRAQIVVHFILVGIISALVLPPCLILWRVSPASPLAGALGGAGLALPFLLLLWLARRMCYSMQKPGLAAIGAGVWFSSVVGGTFILRYASALTPFRAFILMALASFLASWILLRQLGVTFSGIASRTPILWRTVLTENWTYGRWLIGSAALYFIANQTQLFLVAAFLGLGAAGILRAMQIPSLVMTQVVGAAGLLVLPSFSYDFGRGFIQRLRHKALLVSLSLGGVATCFAIVLLATATSAQNLLYGEKYRHYAWIIPVLALLPVASSFSVGCSMALRASQKPKFDLYANAVAAPVCVISTIVFLHWWGLAGAAASMVLSVSTISGVTCFFFWRLPRVDGNQEVGHEVPSLFGGDRGRV